MTKNNFHQQQNLAELNNFFCRKTPVIYFLALTVFFTVIIIVFREPIGLLQFTTQQSGIDPQLQLAITAVAGWLVVCVSRMVLHLYSLHNSITTMGCFLWLLVELVITITVLCITIWLVSGAGKLDLAPLAGDFVVGVLVIEVMPYIITYLVFRIHEEHSEVLKLQEQLSLLQPQETIVAGPLSDRTLNFYDKAKRLVFSTNSNNILYIESADNYTNIHYLNDNHEETFILHNTLKELENQMADTSLLRCHRGYIVNIDNVKLLRKSGSSLLLELSGSSKTIPVTKTFAPDITAHLVPTTKTNNTNNHGNQTEI